MLRRLPKSEWTIHLETTGVLFIGAHERGGYRQFTKVELPHPPNDLARFDDLERLIVDVLNAVTVS